MAKGRLYFDGDNAGIEKEARVYSLTQDVTDKLDSIDTIESTLQGEIDDLQDQINNLAARGRFLSTWDTETGLPDTNPQVSPYTYRSGDYYIVSNVGSGTNYRPQGSSYTIGVASTDVETEPVSVNDVYVYDGVQWNRIGAFSGTISWGSIVGTLSNQTDLQNALDGKVNLGNNMVYDNTVVEIGKWVHGQMGDSSGHHVTIDPNGEISTYNVTTPGYNEATLGSGNLTLLSNVALTGNKTLEITTDTITADDGINTQIYSFLGSNRIATLNDITAHTIPELHTSDVYYDLITTTPGTYKLVDSGKYLGYTYMIPSGVGYVTKPAGGNFTTGGNGILYFKGELDWTYIEGGTIIRSDMRYVQGGTGSNGYEFIRLAPMAGFSAPVGPYRGQLWYDISADTLKVYDDSNNWVLVDTDEVVVSTTAPSNPTLGLLWYDSTNNVLKAYDGTNWNACGGGSTYSAGNGISIDANNEISIDTTVVATQTDIANFFNKTSDDADDIDDTNSTNKFVTATEKSTWSGKQDAFYTIASSSPANPSAGDEWFDTTNNVLKVYDGTNWNTVDTNTTYSAGTGIDITSNTISTDSTVMRYPDYNWVTKTGNSITLDLSSQITPSANFTVNAPATIEDGQIYLLRVSQGATVYTMTLGTHITNPYGASLTMEANSISQFSFLAVGGDLELQQVGVAKEYVDDNDTYIGASAPVSNLVEGRLWYDTTNDVLKAYDGTNWDNVDTDTTYSAGNGINIDANNEISVDTSVIATQTDIANFFDKTSDDADDIDDTNSTNKFVTTTEKNTWDGKQDELIAGTNIQIAADGKTISATDTIYSAGTGLTLNGTTFNVDTTTIATKADIANLSSFEVVSVLPSVSSADLHTIYLLGPLGTGADKYEEWIVTDATSTQSFTSSYDSGTTTTTRTPDSVTFSTNTTLTYSTSTEAADMHDKGIRFHGISDDYFYWHNPSTDVSGWYTAPGGTLIDATTITIPAGTYSIDEDGADRGFNSIEFSASGGKQWTKIGETSVDLTNYFNTSTQTSDAITQGSTNLFLTSAERTVLGNTSNTNTGDETTATIKTKLGAATSSSDGYLTSADWSTFNGKQNALTAGDGIDITNNVISADIAAGTGINISNQNCITESDRKGPAPSGFYVPSSADWQGVKTIMDGLSLTTGDDWRINLHMPFFGRRNYSTADFLNQSYGYYWSSSPYGSGRPSYAINLQLRPSLVGADNNIRRAYGLPVRCFKDSYTTPDSSWTVVQGTLGSAGIFWNQSDGLISITSNGTTGYTIADKNVGATTAYSDGDTLTEANMGYMYQWGNNYGFPSTGTISNTSTIQVDASNYGPSTANGYYEDNTFIIESDDWSSAHNDDLWGDTSNSTHQECTTTTTLTISSSVDISGKQDKATSGSTAPSTTPSYVGQQYVDTTNDKMYVATGTSSSSDWMEVGAGSGDMLYADFNWASKTGATVTLDLNSTITPSANFTVNAPSTIKDGQIYVLRVTQGATAYTMTLGTNVTNPYGESLTMSAYTVNQFSFLAVGGNLELQPSVTVGESGAKIFYANTGDTGHEISDIGEELETWLNATGQTDDYDTFKDAVLVYDGVTYNRRNTFYTDSGYKYIYFISRNPNVQNNNNGTSKGYYSLVRFKFSYSSGWSYESDYSTSYITTTTQSFLRTDFDYSTPYTPLYNGSPATKKYVDDSIVTYTAGSGISISNQNVVSASIYPSSQTGAASTVKIWVGTQSDYNSLASYDSGTLYFTTSS